MNNTQTFLVRNARMAIEVALHELEGAALRGTRAKPTVAELNEVLRVLRNARLYLTASLEPEAESKNYYLLGHRPVNEASLARAMVDGHKPAVARQNSTGDWDVFFLSATPAQPCQAPFQLTPAERARLATES